MVRELGSNEAPATWVRVKDTGELLRVVRCEWAHGRFGPVVRLYCKRDGGGPELRFAWWELWSEEADDLSGFCVRLSIVAGWEHGMQAAMFEGARQARMRRGQSREHSGDVAA